jgi:hypothetical protein
MATDEPVEPVPSLQDLSSAAKNLNKSTDELVSLVDSLNKSFQAMNIGLYASAEVCKWCSSEDARYEKEILAYQKLNGAWTIAIRTEVGDEEDPIVEEKVTVWAFKDAPRDLRIRAVAKIPDLIKALTINALDTTEQVNKAINNAKPYFELSDGPPSRMSEAFKKAAERK